MTAADRFAAEHERLLDEQVRRERAERARHRARPISIRDATAADLPWINTNTEGWTVNERYVFMDGAYSLERAWALPIASNEGDDVGWAYVTERDSYLALVLVYVAPDHRNRGVARALIRHIFDAYPGEIILTRPDAKLHKLWPKLGFTYEPPSHGDLPGYPLGGTFVRPPIQSPADS